MKVSRFNHVYLTMLKKWLQAREMDLEMLNDIPELGFVVEGIAAGFIRKCEGDYGLIDSFITNPEASPQDRDEALNLITNQLVIKAKSMRIKALTAITVDENTLSRAKKHGFVELPHATLILDLHKKA